MTKKATIYEVARRVGVSTATVSRVLNDSPNVSEDTKKKVQEMIEELNFSPQMTARKLARGKPQMLAIVVPSFTTPYYNEVLKGVKDEVQQLDLDIMMYNTGSQNREEGLIRLFDRGMADGFLIISIDLNEEAHGRLKSSEAPTVLVNSSYEGYHSFSMDDYRGGFIAGEHLAQQGFNTIGMIDSPLADEKSSPRKKGFLDGLKKHDCEITEDFFVQGTTTKHAGYTEESGFEAIYKLNERGRFPEAIFCSNDTQAVGAMHALSKLGMNVPEDIAVMGYDNIKLSKYLDLTTIDQKMYSVGVKAIRCLQQLFEKSGEKPHQQAIQPVLVERGSTSRSK